MLGTYFVVGLLGLLAFGLAGWVVAGEINDRRKARAAARYSGRFQRTDSRPSGGSS